MSQHVWAANDDWELHQQTITRLYWDECRPLPEVMEIMRSEHNFHATYVGPFGLLGPKTT